MPALRSVRFVMASVKVELYATTQHPENAILTRQDICVYCI